jgi:thioredoxin-like negative regulator of GroEL
MAAARPTNEHIAAMLAQVLRELGEVRKAQEHLLAEMRGSSTSAHNP